MPSRSVLPSHWAVSIPVGREGRPDGVHATLMALSNCAKAKAPAGKKTKYVAELSQFDIPDGLHVGTLDDLLRLADQVETVTAFSEQCLRSHEAELAAAAARAANVSTSGAAAGASAAGAATSGAGAAGKGTHALSVGATSVHAWIRKSFLWDAAQYDPREPLQQLLDRVRETVAAIDTQRRDQVAAVGAAKASLDRAAQASRGGLQAKPLAWLLTPAVVEDTGLRRRFFDCGSGRAGAYAGPLRSEFVVVRGGREAEWLARYESVGRGAVREALEGDAAAGALAAAAPDSPVVPRSAFKVLTEAAAAATGAPAGSEPDALWMVTILSGFKEEFRAALARDCRGIAAAKTDMDDDAHQRAVVRSRIMGEAAADGEDAARTAEAELARARADASAAVSDLQAQLADAEARLLRDCQGRYEEAVRTHLHCLGLHLFVESVLRYGLPATFAFALVRAKSPAEAETLLATLRKEYSDLATPDDDDDAPATRRGGALSGRLPMAHVVAEFPAEVAAPA